MYQLKLIPEDFIVKEVIDVPVSKEGGNYSYFFMTKINYNTYEAISMIAKKLNIKPKRIGFAGNKDKKAITTQLISFFRVSSERVLNLNLKDIKLEFVGYGKKRICLGDHIGNEFIITIRNLTKEELDKAIKKLKEGKVSFLNLYGKQRFSKDNHIVGKFVVRREFREAARLLIKDKVYGPLIKEQLDKYKNDFVGALRKIPKKILRLYVHSYQSYLWNKIALEAAKLYKRNVKIPIIGHSFKKEKVEKSLLELIENILQKEGIKPQDFLIKQMPEIFAEGSSRNLYEQAKNIEIIESCKDELNPQKFKLKINFFLNKGSYATVFIDSLFN